MRNKVLTEKQKQILALMNDRSLWRPPSILKLMKLTNSKWTQSVVCHLNALVKKGYLDSEYKPI